MNNCLFWIPLSSNETYVMTHRTTSHREGTSDILPILRGVCTHLSTDILFTVATASFFRAISDEVQHVCWARARGACARAPRAINVRATLRKNVNVKDDGAPFSGKFRYKNTRRAKGGVVPARRARGRRALAGLRAEEGRGGGAGGGRGAAKPPRHCNPIKWIRNEFKRRTCPTTPGIDYWAGLD
ncbi:hypothetical protein EVAR_21791_1 [Eumeta japonica]|uniref:Uncharacterized protein n=1 Tax=Eumeta variegata TaxID=151549 RepID=A0A4C1YG33_EUMVA|nr:hypothetical protein EVAR_21791_1 [Eumeta japonica]